MQEIFIKIKYKLFWCKRVNKEWKKIKKWKELKNMNKKQNPYRLYLTEEQMPKKYYNLRADMKELPEPMLNPMTKKK